MTRTNRRGVGVACALAALLPAFVCPRAEAQVKTRIRADGTLEIYNDGPGASFGSRPLQLRPVPQVEWSDWIRENAARHGVDPRLVQSIVQVESGYNARARSHKGAVGLMQLMPATARELEVGDRYNPEQNIRGGVAYLRQMIDLFAGRLELAIAAYNAGPAAVQRHQGVPPYPETREYVDRVLSLYRGESLLLIGFSGGGGPVRVNGLVQALGPSPLQEALANGLLRSAGPAAPAAVAAGPELARAPAVAQPAAVMQPNQPAVVEPTVPQPGAVVPASLPLAAEPATPQPASGG